MERGAIYSAILHLAVILLVFFGLPHFKRELQMELPVPVDVVTIAATTNAPPPPAKVETPKPEPPKPEPPKAEEVKPPEPPKPEALTPPEPKPEPPKPEAPKEVAELPTPEVKPKTKPEPLKDVKPERKPPPPDDMESILKSVDKLKPQQHEETPVETAEALKSRPSPARPYNPTAPVSISQIDAIRRHFEKCWNVPAGARDAQDLAVNIRVTLGPDATVQHAEYVDTTRMGDPFYRAAAESAMRAVMNPLCHSLQEIGLQPDQYDEWKDLDITFDPKQMIGA